MTLLIHRTKIQVVLLTVFALILVPALLIGAKGPGPAYNAASIVTVAGTVTEVRDVPAGSPLAGWHITIKSEEGTFEAYLGPASFFKLLKTSFANGDRVRVIGSKVAGADTQLILVKEITKKDVTITLREDDGAPVWENWGVPVG